MQILRFLTAGSVDDGKSTLIGRLLYDCKALPGDTLEYLENPRNRLPDGSVNLALLTDGLRAEREQGITIDVAYKYFATEKRKFIIADTPGHIQYTRNMVTGASNADLAIILVDARHGVIEQTHRHSFIASLLGIPHLVVCINKMDMVEWSADRFNEIQQSFAALATRLQVRDIAYIPVSALQGDNVVHRSVHSLWYQGPTLLDVLETAEPRLGEQELPSRFPVQIVIRPQSPEFPDFRGFAGQVASGSFKVGQSVVSLPSGARSKIRAIRGLDAWIEEVRAPLAATILLEDEIDTSRGDMLVPEDSLPLLSNEVDAWVCWMDHIPGLVGKKLLLRQGPRQVKAMLQSVEYLVDINTFAQRGDTRQLALNDIARVRLRLAASLPHDPYVVNRSTGSFILVDEGTNLTAAAGVILEPGKDLGGDI